MKRIRSKSQFQPLEFELIAQASCEDPAFREALKWVRANYKNPAIVLGTYDLQAKQGPIRGSSSYSRYPLVEGYREVTQDLTAFPITPRQSERALSKNMLITPIETYEDLGFIVKPRNIKINPRLCNYLIQQVKADFPNVNPEEPFILTGLPHITEHDDYENGLKVDANKLTIVYNNPILNQSSDNFDSDDPGLLGDGLPSKLGKGKRTLYNSDVGGVFRFFRNRDLGLDAGLGGLANSDGGGRVNVAKNFPGGNNFSLEDYTKRAEERIAKKYQAEVDRLKKIVDKSIAEIKASK